MKFKFEQGNQMKKFLLLFLVASLLGCGSGSGSNSSSNDSTGSNFKVTVSGY